RKCRVSRCFKRSFQSGLLFAERKEGDHGNDIKAKRAKYRNGDNFPGSARQQGNDADQHIEQQGIGRGFGFGMHFAKDLGGIAHAAKLKSRTAGSQDNAVKRGDQAKEPDDNQSMIDPMAAAYHLRYGQRKGRIRSRLTASGIDDIFPSPYPYGRGKGKKAKDHQGQQGRTKADQDISLGIDGFFRHIGNPFYGKEKPDGKRNGGKYAEKAVGQGILLQVVPLYFRQADTGKEHQAHHRDQCNQQLKSGSHFKAGDIQAGEHKIGGYGDQQGVNVGEKEVEISTYGRSDGRRGKDKLNILRHAGKKAQMLAQTPFRIGKSPTCSGNCAGHLRIAKGKGDIHDNDKEGSDGEAKRTPFRQAEVPAKVVAGDHIAYAQAP